MYIDALDRLWILDTGRALADEKTLVPATPGGPKLVCVNLTNDEVVRIITFPPEVAGPFSYLNDVRFDVQHGPMVGGQNLKGKGIAYISDSSPEGKNGIVIVDLATGTSWRVLDTAQEVHAEPGFVPFIGGKPVYFLPGPRNINIGISGITLSRGLEYLYFGAVGSRNLYRVPTWRLVDRSVGAEKRAVAAITNLSERGVSHGFCDG